MSAAEEDRLTRVVVNVGATMLQAGARLAPGPAGPVMELLGALLRAVETAMRDQGKSVTEIIQAIKMPRPLDLEDERSAIDERVRDLPEKG